MKLLSQGGVRESPIKRPPPTKPMTFKPSHDYKSKGKGGEHGKKPSRTSNEGMRRGEVDDEWAYEDDTGSKWTAGERSST